jgi:transcription elongation factor Elf1
MNAPINRAGTSASARAIFDRAIAAAKARESVPVGTPAPQPDVEPVIPLAVEDHKIIMNENQITTTCSCPSCGTRLRLKITNPDNGIGSATCSFCCRSFRFEVPFHVMADYWRKQRERRASRSNLQSII